MTEEKALTRFEKASIALIEFAATWIMGLMIGTFLFVITACVAKFAWWVGSMVW